MEKHPYRESISWRSFREYRMLISVFSCQFIHSGRLALICIMGLHLYLIGFVWEEYGRKTWTNTLTMPATI